MISGQDHRHTPRAGVRVELAVEVKRLTRANRGKSRSSRPCGITVGDSMKARPPSLYLAPRTSLSRDVVGTLPPVQTNGPVLVTGASGYVGGLLVGRLLGHGVPVRAAGRRPEVLRERWPDVEAVEMDVFRPETIRQVSDGVGFAYYLVHSMAEGESGFEERDRVAARNFAEGARRSGVETVVYLGGLGSQDDRLSAHLESRHETGRLLAQHGPPSIVELRASMVLGAGSASFRMLIDLVRRLPAMVTPRWVETRSQPIAIDDVLAYLEGAGSIAATGHQITEIGGADVLTYRDMMLRVAARRGRRPLIVSVPLLTPRLSSLWCGLVTSVPASIARPLIEGLRNETVVRDDTASRLFPNIRPMGFDEAVTLALGGSDRR